MQLSFQSRDLRIREPAQAAAFANQLRCRILIACVGREMNLSQLQLELGSSFAKLHYHVERLLASGLLVVHRREPRAGRAIRYYRATADRFWVSQTLLPQLPAEDWSTELREALRKENRRAGLSLLYAPDQQGKMMVRLVRSDDSSPPRSMEIWKMIQLDPEQRSALARDLDELIQRYSLLNPGKGAKTYLVHGAFAPVD